MAANADVTRTGGGVLKNNEEKQSTSPGVESGSKTPTTTTTTTTTKNNTTSSSSKDAHNDDDSEFTIAADLTLYANPLRCLKKTARPAAQHEAERSGSGDMIATDLVKYGSPLDDNPN